VIGRINARMLPLASRGVDLAATAPACCNACRTCATTNVVMAAVGVAVALGGFYRGGCTAPPGGQRGEQERRHSSR
jgi:hypothetical protein